MPGAPGRRAAVFLDRDGVLNAPIIRDGHPFAPSSLSELVILPGVPEACRTLREEGFLLIVVTNQPELARGTLETKAVQEVHEELKTQLPLDAIYLCPHDDNDQCSCRKPAPGLVLTAADEHGIDIRRSFLIGDRWRDIETGQRAGCRTIFVNRGYRERRASGADAEVYDLAEAAEWIRVRKEASLG